MARRPKADAAGVAALEVSPRTAKVLVATQGPFQVQRLQAVTLPEPTEDPTASLRKLLEAHPLGVHEAGVVLGREAFSLRTLELPSVAPKEIASMLELQLGKLTPYPRGEILSGWATVGSFREGYTSVLLAVSRKTLVEGVLALLHAKGIAPRWVSVSSEGLERWWTHVAKFGAGAPSGQLTAVIDIDVASTDCAILSDGRLLFSHSIALGAEQLRAAEPSRLRWVSELIRLPRVLLHEDVKGQIGRGVLTGLTESLGQLAEQLTGQWGVPVDVVDALAAASLSPAVRTLTQAHPAAYTALAGCLATATPPRIDLLPPETRVSQALQVRSRHLARLAASLIAILVFAGVLYLERIIILRGYVAQLRDRLASVERTSEQVIERRQTMQRINRWLDPSRSALEVLRTVAEAVDADITVTHLTFAEADPVTLRGRAAAMPSAYAFFDRLKSLGLFASVHARSVAKSRGADSTTADFELVCELPAS